MRGVRMIKIIIECLLTAFILAGGVALFVVSLIVISHFLKYTGYV